MLHTLHPGDQRPADWAAAHASLDNPATVARLLDALRDVGATGQVATLLDREPPPMPASTTRRGVAGLLAWLRDAGATSQVTTLASRAAAHASLDDPGGVAVLLNALRKAGATSQVAALATRAADDASLDDPVGVAGLLDALRGAGATGQITRLLDRDPAAHASLDDPVRRGRAAGRAARGGGHQPGHHAGQPRRRRRQPQRPERRGQLLGALHKVGATARSPSWPAEPPTMPASKTQSAWLGCWARCAGWGPSRRSQN